MDVSEYDCGIRQDEHKKIKLGESYSIAVDSGYDSIYNGCASVLMEKSFSRESFDIFSPNSTNRTPSKQSSALKYHISTPKSNASVKRHLYSTLNSSSISKRIKSENEENEPKTASKSGQQHDSSCPLKTLNRCDFPRQNYLHTSTSVKIQKDELFDNKHSTYEYNSCGEKEQVLMPGRPSKSQRYFTPTVIHSKRKLNIVPSDEKPVRTYCNGTKYLNIILRLERFPVIIDDIFKKLTSKDLLNMTQVSKNWSRIVKSNSKANARVHRYLSDSRNVKENRKEPVKPPIVNVDRHPFGTFNLISTSKINPNTTPVSSSFYENQNVVQQLCKNERLVKCPRCSKGSIVSDSHQRLTALTRVPISTCDSQCATNVFHNTASDSILPITKESAEPKSVNFGVCTSLACKFMFCPKCLCDYHPGENCKISEPESPSKLLICRKNAKHKSKSNCKLNSKRQSLRRLCFS